MKINIIIPDTPSDINLNKFLPNGVSSFEGAELILNGDSTQTYDCVVVIDNITRPTEYKTTNGVIFCTAEIPFITNYFRDTAFLNQFDAIYSPHAIYNHPNVTANLPFQPWMINARHGCNILKPDNKYNYDTLSAMDCITKTKAISIISSNKYFTEFHRVRYEFALALKRYFKDRLDLYGSGHAPFDSKITAVMPYKYHIVAENQITPNIITEKLYDSYLGLAYPIYCGCTNVADYFDKESYSEINIYDLNGSIKKIEEILEDDQYDSKLPALIEAKNRVLNDYNPFIRIAKICLERSQNSRNVASTRLLPRHALQEKDPKKSHLQKLKNSIRKRIRNLKNKI